MCQPPNAGVSTPPRGSVGENGGVPTASPSPGPGTTPTVPDAPPKDDSDPNAGGGGAETPVTPAPGAANTATTSTPKPSEETPSDGSHNAAVDDDVDEGKEGCSISQTGGTRSAPTGAGWALAAGFAAFFARRRNSRG
jgi:MYXO-CTERM domain-containing protein